jgi:hypothetical protein
MKFDLISIDIKILPNIMLDSNTLISKSESLLNDIENIINNINFTITINNIYLNTVMDLISNNLMVSYYDDVDMDNITDSINVLTISIFFTYGEDTSDNKINIIKNNIELERVKTEINLLINIINTKTTIYKSCIMEHIKNNFNSDLYTLMTDMVGSLIII